MSQVISFRLDPDNPREGRALEALRERQEQGYRVRHILAEALLRLVEVEQRSEVELQMTEVLATLNVIRATLEQLQNHKIAEPGKGSTKSEEQVSEAFILSVKSAAKPGIRLHN
jgi:hypothetical protein